MLMVEDFILKHYEPPISPNGLDSLKSNIPSSVIKLSKSALSIGSDTVPTKKLEELTKPPDAISETVEEANESAEEKINNLDLQEKPLGVREAEGKVIGE